MKTEELRLQHIQSLSLLDLHGNQLHFFNKYAKNHFNHCLEHVRKTHMTGIGFSDEDGEVLLQNNSDKVHEAHRSETKS